MTFQQFKDEVCKLARRKRIAYKVPGDNFLLVAWEKRVTPENLINFIQRKCSLHGEPV